MDEKTKSTLHTITGVLAIPVAAVLLYGAYYVFTFKPAPKPPEPKVEAFRAEQREKPDAPKPKKGEPTIWHVELVWEVINADTVTIDQGVGKVELKGSKPFEIEKDTTFTLKAKNVTGEITSVLDVNVPSPEK